MTLLAFHCLLRIGEITSSEHNLSWSSLEILARNLTKAGNLTNAKSVLILRFGSMKMDSHGEKEQLTWCATEINKPICPVQHMYQYLAIRPNCNGPLFCTPEGNPVPHQAYVLAFSTACALAIGNSSHYKTHSLHMGCAVYMLLSGWTLEQIMATGHWVMPDIAKRYCQSIQCTFQTM